MSDLAEWSAALTLAFFIFASRNAVTSAMAIYSRVEPLCSRQTVAMANETSSILPLMALMRSFNNQQTCALVPLVASPTRRPDTTR
jgi:hypothetical protein